MATLTPREQRALELQSSARRSLVADTSEAAYLPHMVEFIRHLDKKYPHYLNTDFRANAIRESGSEMLDKGYVRSALSFDNGRRSGSVLTKEAEENMDADAISIFICSAERQDETRSSLTVFNTRRSAVSFLFRIFGRGGFPVGATVEIQNSFKGLKRVLVQEKAQSGTAKVQEGKEALKFGLYRYLNRKLLDSTERDAIFTHCYQTLSWNLMCRAGNTADIKYLHLRWDEDSLGVYFAQMKNDKDGDRPKDARHVYANPVLPEICPILALGLYFLVFGFDAKGCSLFSGTSQYNRYLKQLRRLLNREEEELSSNGLQPSDLGTHSTRKGAASYTSSGTTSCPPIIAITLRAGWTMSKIESTYYRFEGAGDMHVGRTVTGLPPHSPDFAILPPFFEQRTALVTDAVQRCFPRAPGTLSREILEMCLASVVHHTEFLRTISPNHPVFQSVLFSDPVLMQQLKPLVVCRRATPADRIQPTGIPLEVEMMGQIDQLRKDHDAFRKEVTQHLTQQPQVIIDGMSDRFSIMLEERAIRAQSVTPLGLNAELQVLKDWLEVRLSSEARRPTREEPNEPPPIVEQAKIPADFKLPKVGPQQAWQLYWLGNNEKKYPPLRSVRARDFSTKTGKNRFGEFRSLMRTIEQELKSKYGTEWRDPVTLEEVNRLYAEGCHVIEVPDVTPKNRRRRVNELSWNTVKKLHI